MQVCRGLISSGICGALPQSELFHVKGQPLLNEMFSVSKNEVVDSVELPRLIMNLIPVNRLCRSLQGDTGTLPSVAQFSAFYLDDSEVVTCFYYFFRLPDSWHRFMAFSKPLPPVLTPDCWKDKVCYLFSRALPMGFVNSVGLAQHIIYTVMWCDGVLLTKREGRKRCAGTYPPQFPKACSGSIWTTGMRLER